MPRVRLKIEVPRDALTEFSLNHPNDELRIFASRQTENGLTVLVEVNTGDATELFGLLEDASEIKTYEVLRSNEHGVLVQIEATEHPSRAAARAVGMLPQYPMILRNGWQTIETITSWDRLSQLKAEFEQADVAFEVLSVNQSVEMTGLLTDRQLQVMTEAITRGYYNSPRECSLTDLADALDVNPSAVSGILHRAEEKIIKAFAAETKQITDFDLPD